MSWMPWVLVQEVGTWSDHSAAVPALGEGLVNHLRVLMVCTAHISTDVCLAAAACRSSGEHAGAKGGLTSIIPDSGAVLTLPFALWSSLDATLDRYSAMLWKMMVHIAPDAIVEMVDQRVASQLWSFDYTSGTPRDSVLRPLLALVVSTNRVVKASLNAIATALASLQIPSQWSRSPRDHVVQRGILDTDLDTLLESLPLGLPSPEEIERFVSQAIGIRVEGGRRLEEVMEGSDMPLVGVNNYHSGTVTGNSLGAACETGPLLI